MLLLTVGGVSDDTPPNNTSIPRPGLAGLADAIEAEKRSATMSTRRTRATVPAAAIEVAVTGDPVVVTDHGTTDLATLACRATRSAQTESAVGHAAANSILAQQVGATLDIRDTHPTKVSATVEGAIGGDPIGGANHRPAGLVTFTRRATNRPELKRSRTAARSTAHAIRAEERIATTGSIDARATLISATVHHTIAGDSVRCTDRGSTNLAALARHRTHRAGWQASRRCITADAVRAKQRPTASGSIETCAALVAATIQISIAGNTVRGAHGGAAHLATFTRCRTNRARLETAARGSTTDTVGAQQGIATPRPIDTGAALVATAVERTVARYSV